MDNIISGIFERKKNLITYLAFVELIFIIFCITETYFQLFIKFRAFLRPCTKNGATVSHGKKT